MASDRDQEKKGDGKLGRTSWDVLAAVIGNPWALGALALVAVIAVMLAVLGFLRLSYGKEGWVFCLPCNNSGAASTPHESPATQATSGQASAPKVASANPISDASDSIAIPASNTPAPPNLVSAPSPSPPEPLLASMLNVPIYTSLVEAKKAVPTLKIKTSDNGLSYISYNQDFLGIDDFSILESLNNNDLTVNARLVKQVQYYSGSGFWNNEIDDKEGYKKQVEDACYGKSYNTLVESMSLQFGTPKSKAPSSSDVSSDINPAFWVEGHGFCTGGYVDICKVKANRTIRTLIFFKKFPGTITLTSTLTDAFRESKAKNKNDNFWATEEFVGCHWLISVEPN